MRIWIINHYAVPETGAAGTRHAVLARTLSGEGHDVTIFASALPDGRRATVELEPGTIFMDLRDGAVRFRFVRTRTYRDAPGRFRSMIEFRSGCVHSASDLAPPDVVIGSSVHLHASDAGRRLARRFRVPFVFEIRDPWPEALVEFGAVSRFHPIYLYLAWLERRCLWQAAGVITLLPNYSRYLESRGVDRQRILYLPNGVDMTVFPALPAPPPENPFVVSYFGAHGPVNGLDTVVRAAAILEGRGVPVRFRIVGDGSEKQALRRLATSLGVQHVEFLDPVPKRELASLAATSHAFVFHLKDVATLRRYGISSNKLFDYMLAARPVIFACRSANNPVLEAGSGVVAEPESPESLADAVMALRAMPPSDREAMGQRGRAWVQEHHDLARLGSHLSRWLSSLTGSTAGRDTA